MAADMPVAPPPPPVVYYDWSGAYIGFNAGSSGPTSIKLSATAAPDREARITSRLAPAMVSSASTPARSGSGAPGFSAPKLH